MVTPHAPSGSYSSWLRAKRQRRGRPTITAARAIQIGDWTLADLDGALVVIHRPTGARTILTRGGESNGTM